MRRIAFISTNEPVPWGGSEYCWSAAAERFVRDGIEVRVSVKHWEPPVREIEHLRSVGCQISYRPIPTLPIRIKRRLFFRNGYLWHHLKEVGNGTDLIVISQGNNYSGLDWMEAAQSLGLKYVVISQLANEQWWPADDVAERLAACYEAACAAYFVSDANLKLTRRQLVSPLGRARVIRNPFNVRYDALPSWPSDSLQELRLACVARLDLFQKGQDLVTQVLDRQRWRTRNVRITFAGTGQHQRILQRTVAALKLQGIEFPGFVGNIEHLWSQHHALLLPSRFEGMPLALIEAMLCGRPCIVTDVAGHSELVRDGINGFLAKAPTIDFVDEAMNRAWENRHRLKQMGEAAARDVRQWVSPDPTSDFVRELDELVQPKC